LERIWFAQNSGLEWAIKNLLLFITSEVAWERGMELGATLEYQRAERKRWKNIY
jgi:hypothetical protein